MQLIRFLSALYDSQKAFKGTIRAEVQTILNSLNHVVQALPVEDAIDFGQSNLRISRTSVSLHIDFFQVG